MVWDGVDDDGVIEVRSSAGSQFYAASDVVAALRDARSSEVLLGGEHGLAPLAELALSGARVTGMPPFQFSDSMCAAGGPSGVVLATSRTGDRGPIAARVADLGSDPGVGPNLFADAPGWSAQMGFDMSAFFLFSGRRVLSRTYSCIKVFDVAACGPAMTAAPPLPSITTAAELVRSKSSGLAPMEVVDRRQSRDESGKDSLEVRMRFAVSAVEVSDVVRRVREREAASRLSDDGGEAAAEVGAVRRSGRARRPSRIMQDESNLLSSFGLGGTCDATIHTVAFAPYQRLMAVGCSGAAVLYDLESGEALASVALAEWDSEAFNTLVIIDGWLVHVVRTTSGGSFAVHVYELVSDARRLAAGDHPNQALALA